MNLLLLDLDGPLPANIDWRIRLVCWMQSLRVVWIRYDRTRRGWHVVVCLRRPLGFQRRILLQSLCGSDWVRESWNAARALHWRDVPPFWRCRGNVLYHSHCRS